MLWQNARLAILWDVSYLLENASRIAAGDVPYRDFPFPFAPLTFLVQAAIIRIFGRVYWHHIAYAAVACAVATALTFLIARRLTSATIAVAFTAPLVLLGIYCVFPHPFYDPDCCLVIVALIAALMSERRPMLVGALCVVPLFVKQNVGLPFVAAALLLFVVERRWRALAGLIVGGATALAIVTVVFGAGNYVRWTIGFAAARRLPPLATMIGVYNDPVVWLMIASVVAGGVLLRRWRWLGGLLIAAPWLWIAWRFFITDDAAEREINLLRQWPVMLIVATIAAIVTRRMLPLLIVATVNGAFLSQQTWGSTYGIWPLLILLFVFAAQSVDAPPATAIVIGGVMLLSAWHYIATEGRLTYAKWSEGEMRRSNVGSLCGLRMRGEWLPPFEELVAWSDAHIPRDDGILSLPGEDLFYFATGRRPRFPVLMFDRTVNPYPPAEIAALAEQRDIRWVIVKRELQLNGTPFPELGDTIHLLRRRYEPVAFLRNYVVFVAAGRRWTGESERARPRS